MDEDVGALSSLLSLTEAVVKERALVSLACHSVRLF